MKDKEVELSGSDILGFAIVDAMNKEAESKNLNIHFSGCFFTGDVDKKYLLLFCYKDKDSLFMGNSTVATIGPEGYITCSRLNKLVRSEEEARLGLAYRRESVRIANTRISDPDMIPRLAKALDCCLQNNFSCPKKCLEENKCLLLK